MHQNSISFSKQQQEISLITTLPFSSQCSTLMWGLGGIRQVCGQRNVMRGMSGDTSTPHSPPPPSGRLRILRVVVAELGRKCWWNLKWCWKAELEIGVMSAYPHGNNPAYISIFYENAMCRISSKCNMVNIFQRYQYNFDNIINILYCEQHDPNLCFISCYPWHDHIALPPSPLPTFVWPGLSLIKLPNRGTADVPRVTHTLSVQHLLFTFLRPCTYFVR